MFHFHLFFKDYKNPTKRFGLVQSGHHHHIENLSVLSMI